MSRMEKQKSLKLNFIMNAILTMSSFIFPLITFPYISRILLPEGTGKVSFATSLISYFSMIAQLGIPIYGIRACAKVRDNRIELTRTAHELLFINLGMNVFSYLALAVALLTVPRLFEDRTLYIIISATIFLTSVGMEWLYKALEQYTYITIRSIIFKFIALVAMFLFVHEKSDYVIYGGISIFASSASNVFNFINIHKYIDLKPLPKYNVKRHIKLVFIFFAMSCAITVYTNLDTVMLGFMSSNTDVGYYNAAVKIKHILVSLVTSLGTVLLPRSTYYIEKGQINEFKRISNKALNFVALVATPMTIYFILFAKQGIYFLSGNAYDGAILPMQIIMPTLILIGITNIINTINTNMNLRRRELAMLKSIGMTRKEFNKMINLESIMYSTKALIMGIPLGLLGSYGIYKAFASGNDYGFIFPWKAIIIAVLVVYILVSTIMYFALRKMRNENIIETIKDENI